MRASGQPSTRVLVVEDHEEDYRYLAKVFERMHLGSYELEWASSYADGLAALRRGGHDVGLFDYNLGQETGVDLVRAAQAIGARLPILLLTGYQSADVDEAALQAGAVDFLSKDELNPVQLERAIRYALHHSAMRTRLLLSQQMLDLFMQSVPCATAIWNEDGSLLYANEIHRRCFGDRPWPVNRGGGPAAPPQPHVQDGRHWLVNSFAMVGGDQRRLLGFTALDVTERVRAEHENRRTTQLLDSILQNLPVIVGRLDAGGRVSEASGRGLGPAGLQPDALPGLVFADLYPAAAGAIREALAGGAASFALSGRERDAEWHAEFFVTFDAAQGRGATFFGRDVSARRRLERWLLTISDAEQQRIGADLHDGLGQQLTGLSFLATALRDRLAAVRPAEAAQAETISRLANEAVAQSRALARGLCPVQLENAGLLVALEELAGQAETLHGVKCRFEVRGTPPTLEHLTALHLYRITQEAIHNAVRHGGARHVRIAFVSRRHQHRLIVTDDGCGFDAGAPGHAPGGGLRLMGYRAALIGAALTVDSRPGHGTRVHCLFTTFETTHEILHSGKTPDRQVHAVGC